MSQYSLIHNCQVCHNSTEEIFSLGSLPLVDCLIDPKIDRTKSISRYPTPLLYCSSCQLVQLGCMVDPKLLFPLEYPYTSGTTKLLRNNFSELANEIKIFITLEKTDLVLDIGCNDGSLLENFLTHTKVLGVTPENIGHLAQKKGITIIQSYFSQELSRTIFEQYGQPKIITATNVLAHFNDLENAMLGIKHLLKKDGLFISESGYLFSMLEKLQYDSIHHEHLRYYSLTNLKNLFKKFDLDIIYAKQIETHGGSLRIYAAHHGQYPVHESIQNLIEQEQTKELNTDLLKKFYQATLYHKTELAHMLLALKKTGKSIFGISAPGRATVLLNYVGIDANILDCVVEVDGSFKIGKIIPGTDVTIVNENELYLKQPDYALILSWHIAQELIPKLKSKGFRGDFIVPLPEITILKSKDVPEIK